MSSIEPEKNCVARKRKVFEGLGWVEKFLKGWVEKFLKDWVEKFFIQYVHRFFKLLYRNSFSVDTLKKGCTLYSFFVH